MTTNNNNLVQCPHCGVPLDVNQQLVNQISDQYQKEYIIKEKQLQKKEAELELSKKNQEKEVDSKLFDLKQQLTVF